MHGSDAENPRSLAGSHPDRLFRDVVALGLLDAERPTAAERLEAELGADLVAVVRAEVNRSSCGGASPCRVPRRVA